MAHDSSGAKNQPQYSGAGAPADAADLSEIANYAALVGNVKVGTTTEMNLLAGADVWNGLVFSNTTDGFLYRYNGAGFQKLPRTSSAYLSTATDAGGQVTVTHTLGVVPTAVMITGGATGSIPERRTYAVVAGTLTATTFVVRVFRQDTATTLNSNPVDFFWAAFA